VSMAGRPKYQRSTFSEAKKQPESAVGCSNFAQTMQEGSCKRERSLEVEGVLAVVLISHKPSSAFSYFPQEITA